MGKLRNRGPEQSLRIRSQIRGTIMASDPDFVPTTGDGWGWILAYGIVSVIVGLLAFAWPFAATYAASVVIGIFLIAAGVVSVIAGITGRNHQPRTYAIAFGVVTVIIGLIMALEPATGALSLTLLVVIWLAVRGIMEIILGTRVRLHRAWFLILGVVNVLLAIYVFATLPWSALTLPGFILGISFIFGGVTSIMSALAHRKGAHAFTA